MPVVLLEAEGSGYWAAWDRFVREQLLARGFVSPEDLGFYRIFHAPEEAADWVASYYATYHSTRQVGDRLVVRLEHELEDDQVAELNERFPDLAAQGGIAKTDPLPEEADQPDLRAKPRLVFPYNRDRAGRVNELILAINAMGRAL